MNKVYVLPPRENWIVDRFVEEWNEDNADISVSDPNQADVIWLLADWAWDQLPPNLLFNRKVLITAHHFVPSKFNQAQRNNFVLRDALATAYHVPNHFTQEFVAGLTNKPIHLIPYWANQKIWKPTGSKADLRKKHNIPTDAYVVGSFQRDTEGSDLVSPKLEKGPDLLADFIERTVLETDHNVHVLLAGWRRQYIINRLERAGIPYTFIQQPRQEVVNELYQCLDLYPVTARFEGGPQSLVECGLLDIPAVSRDIGIASLVLPKSAIADDVFNAVPAVPRVESFRLPGGYEPYRKLIQSL